MAEEDDAVAAKCIDYLKQNKLGVATFLPLNKIRAREANVNNLTKRSSLLCKWLFEK